MGRRFRRLGIERTRRKVQNIKGTRPDVDSMLVMWKYRYQVLHLKEAERSAYRFQWGHSIYWIGAGSLKGLTINGGVLQ